MGTPSPVHDGERTGFPLCLVAFVVVIGIIQTIGNLPTPTL